MVSEPRLPIGRNWLVAPPTQSSICEGRLLGYPTSVVKGIGDEFISVRESLVSSPSFWD